jgi:membrane complex biogenesis BtpA family protein
MPSRHSVLVDLFGMHQPVIAMVHLPALPGRPRYDAERGMDGIVASLRRDLTVLQDGGVDGVLFCNEDDRPYALHIGSAQIAAMAAAIGELRPLLRLPFGVDMLWDARAAIAVAKAVGAAFVREVFTGTYDSDMGLWSPDAAAILDFRRAISGDGIKLFFNIEPEFARPLAPRPIADVARSVAVSALPDALLISGPMAGAGADLSHIAEAKQGAPLVPVLANTGVRIETVREVLRVADGVIVGTGLKRDGYTWNAVDPERVERFMEQVYAARENADPV